MNPNLSSITPCSFQGIAASIPPHLCSRCPRYPVYSMCPVCTVDAARMSACATGQRNLRSGGVFRQLVILWCARACVFVGQALSPANWFFHSSCGSGLRGIRECIDETVHLVDRKSVV